MIINDTVFNVDCYDIIKELQSQLHINKINLLGVIDDTSDNVMIACPYHKDGQERRPSMGIKKSDGTCHCFACDTVVGLPQLISHCWGYDSEIGAFGWEWLLKNFLTISVEERKDVELDFARNMDTSSLSVGNRNSAINSNTDRFISEEELDKYRYIHPYMYQRKLTDEIIYLFDVGYDDVSKCLTFPIRDRNGNTLFFARRSVNTKFFNYPSGAEKPLYGLYEYLTVAKITDPRESEMEYGIDFTTWDKSTMIICESIIDALTAWTYGKFACALNGLGTALQFKQIRELPCRKIILATDADEAGMSARERIKRNIPNKLIKQYKWDLSVAKDINDMSYEMFNSLEEIF